MFRIIKTPNYYQSGPSTSASRQAYLTDEDGDVMTWAKEKAAQDYVDAPEDGVYVTGSNEAGRPDYEITSDATPNSCLPATATALGMEWEDIPAEHVPAEIRRKLEAADLEDVAYGDESDTYAHQVTGRDGFEYCIVYEVPLLALQINAEDLSRIAWNNAAYGRRLARD